MINKPENYEEAVKIIKDSVDNDLDKKNVKTIKYRAIFATAGCVGLAGILGLVVHNPIATIALLPASGLVGLATLFPAFLHKKTYKDIESGKYFENKSEQEVIDIAQKYTDEKNEFDSYNHKRIHLDDETRNKIIEHIKSQNNKVDQNVNNNENTNSEISNKVR